jgi:hypothetical protein
MGKALDKLLEIATGLESMGIKKNLFSLVAHNGTEFKADVRPDDLPTDEVGQCFKNATLHSIAYNCTYVEGYVFVHGIPLHHAWCIDKNGKVLDTTIPDQEKWEYVGIPMTADFVMEAITSSDVYGVLDNYGFRKIYDMDHKEFVHPNWQK